MTTQATKPEVSDPTEIATPAPTTAASGSGSGTGAAGTEIEIAPNPTTPQPATTSIGNNADQILQDHALPPLPRDAAVEVPDRVIIDEPPPAYMRLPNQSGDGPDNTNNTTQRSGPNGQLANRPENYVIRLEDLYEQPDFVDCPHCHTRQKTTVRHQPSGETTMAAVACCLCCGILPAIIPFCCNWFYDVEHVCPRCVKVVARMPHDAGKMQPVLPHPSKYQPSQFQPAPANAAP